MITEKTWGYFFLSPTTIKSTRSCLSVIYFVIVLYVTILFCFSVKKLCRDFFFFSFFPLSLSPPSPERSTTPPSPPSPPPLPTKNTAWLVCLRFSWLWGRKTWNSCLRRVCDRIPHPLVLIIVCSAQRLLLGRCVRRIDNDVACSSRPSSSTRSMPPSFPFAVNPSCDGRSKSKIGACVCVLCVLRLLTSACSFFCNFFFFRLKACVAKTQTTKQKKRVLPFLPRFLTPPPPSLFLT